MGYRIRTVQVQGPASYTTSGKVAVAIPEISSINNAYDVLECQVTNALLGEVFSASGNTVLVKVYNSINSGTLSLIEVLSGVSLTSSVIRVGAKGY